MWEKLFPVWAASVKREGFSSMDCCGKKENRPECSGRFLGAVDGLRCSNGVYPMTRNFSALVPQRGHASTPSVGFGSVSLDNNQAKISVILYKITMALYFFFVLILRAASIFLAIYLLMSLKMNAWSYLTKKRMEPIY